VEVAERRNRDQRDEHGGGEGEPADPRGGSRQSGRGLPHLLIRGAHEVATGRTAVEMREHSGQLATGELPLDECGQRFGIGTCDVAGRDRRFVAHDCSFV
jgi:hypothetical protein